MSPIGQDQVPDPCHCPGSWSAGAERMSTGKGDLGCQAAGGFGSQQCLPLSGTRKAGDAPRSILNNTSLTGWQLGEWDDKRKDLTFNLYLFASINSIFRQPYFTSCTKCTYTSELGLLKNHSTNKY